MENDLPLSGETASVTTNEEVIQDVADNTEVDNTTDNEGEGEEGAEKPQKTPEQLEINRLRKSTARLTRQREEARAALAYANQQKAAPQAEDSETLSLTRAELNEFVKQQAEQLAPTIQQRQAQVKQREAVIEGLSKSLGKEGFNTLSENLEDALGGFDDGNGNLKPCLEAVFYADNPQSIIEYLGDPDNFEEAQTLASMNPWQTGRAIAKIENKLLEASKTAKPKPSNAIKPLEAVKGGGTIKGMPDPSDTKAYIAWANQQEAGR